MLRLLRTGTRPERRREERTDPLRALAASAAAGDSKAERTLLIEIGSSLLRTVRAILGTHPDIEDVLQETMTAVHLALPGFRGESTIRHFACRIAVQAAMNARRRSRYRSRHVTSTPDEELAEFADGVPSPVDLLAAARRREAMRELLCDLPHIHAEVLALHTMLGYTVEEAAEVIGVPVNTVRSRLRAALVALRRAVNDDGARLQVIKDDV